MKQASSGFGNISRRSLRLGVRRATRSLGTTSFNIGFGAGRRPTPILERRCDETIDHQFVAAVTTAGSPDFVPPDQRIATFDNDGTLWIEQPMYVQLAFILDRVKALAPQNPEWKTKQPFQAVLDSDMKALAASGEKGLVS